MGGDFVEELACRTYSVREAAQVLGPSRNATYGAIYRGGIPALRFGGRIVVPKDTLHRLSEKPRMVRELTTPPRR